MANEATKKTSEERVEKEINSVVRKLLETIRLKRVCPKQPDLNKMQDEEKN